METNLSHLPKLKKGNTCLNCGHILTEEDNFCPRCGQLNDTTRLTFMDWVREILSDFISYDSRLRNSLLPLFKNPGQLSIDYINGQRSSHIHPIRLYLIASFLFFLISSITSFKEHYITTSKSVTDSSNFDISINDDNEGSIYSIVDNITINDSLINVSKNSYKSRFILYLLDIKKYNNKDYKTASDRYNFEKTNLDKFAFYKAIEYSTLTLKELGSVLEKKLPIIAFTFLPFFVIFLNLIHYKKDILYLEHLVFAFYTQSVLFLMLTFEEIASLIYEPLGDTIGNIFIFLIFPIYLFIALKKFYKYPSIKRTVIIFLLLNFIYFFTAFLAIVFGTFFAFFTY